MMIQPKQPLDGHFVKRWISLPKELKLQVLEFILIPEGQSHPHLYSQVKIGRAITTELQETGQVWPMLVHWMYTGQQFCDLTQSIFYGQNTFRIMSSRWPRASRGNLQTLAYDPRYLSMPRPSATRHIRKLQFEMCVTRVEWAKLRNIANKQYGFTGLVRIDILVYMDSGMIDVGDGVPGIPGDITWTDKARQLATMHIVFSCEGSLGVHRHLQSSRYFFQDDETVDEVRQILIKAISFGEVETEGGN
jgi:hypothetical protein